MRTSLPHPVRVTLQALHAGRKYHKRFRVKVDLVASLLFCLSLVVTFPFEGNCEFKGGCFSILAGPNCASRDHGGLGDTAMLYETFRTYEDVVRTCHAILAGVLRGVVQGVRQ